MNEALLQRYKQFVDKRSDDYIAIMSDGFALYTLACGTMQVYDHNCGLVTTCENDTLGVFVSYIVYTYVHADIFELSYFRNNIPTIYYPPKCSNTWVFSAIKRCCSSDRKCVEVITNVYATEEGLRVKLNIDDQSEMSIELTYPRNNYYSKPNFLYDDIVGSIKHFDICNCKMCVSHRSKTVIYYDMAFNDAESRDMDLIQMKIWRAVCMMSECKVSMTLMPSDIDIKLTC